MVPWPASWLASPKGLASRPSSPRLAVPTPQNQSHPRQVSKKQGVSEWSPPMSVSPHSPGLAPSRRRPGGLRPRWWPASASPARSLALARPAPRSRRPRRDRRLGALNRSSNSSRPRCKRVLSVPSGQPSCLAASMLLRPSIRQVTTASRQVGGKRCISSSMIVPNSLRLARPTGSVNMVSFSASWFKTTWEVISRRRRRERLPLTFVARW